MVDRKIIGKVQIIIGIIILVVGILGFFSLIYLKNNFEKEQVNFNKLFQQAINQNEDLSEEGQLVEINSFRNEAYRMIYDYKNQKYFIILASAILIVLSLIFLTHGLLNLENKNGS